ncbi:hypothetical protein ATL17_0894 [Maritalea mobilis]|uniref:Uncharacterized protein n=1 Tax=Maritalea mobilis TaxID=483324 RepID=A0A4V3DBK2_9HYPH|nr:hypothetical protein [Maritalea mobilis]TDQ66888.1 hypothetical protein ATL17_0894 [Maritalea mobilis]
MKNLITFLDTPANSHAKESILMHRLFLDVKTSAARHGYYLNTYFDTVDHDGFDVIFDDQDNLIKTQLKSVRSDAKTRQWKIRKSVMRPALEVAEDLGFEFSPEGVGVGGGALLMRYGEENNEIVAQYYYTDAYIMSAFQCNLIQYNHSASKKAIQSCLTKLHQDSGSGMLTVPKPAFLKVKDTDSLLALMQLHGPISSSWSENLVALSSYINGHRKLDDLPSPPTKLREHIWNEIVMLIDQRKLTHGAFDQD